MLKTKQKLAYFKNTIYTKYTLKSSGNYLLSIKKTNSTQFAISYRGPHIRNKLIKSQTQLINLNNPKFKTLS